MTELDYNPDQKEVSNYIKQVQAVDGVYVRPIRAYREKQLWKRDPARKKIWRRDLRYLVLYEINYRLKNAGNLIIGIFGGQGEGKSTAGKSIGFIKTDMYYDLFKIKGRLFFSFSNDETLAFIKIAKPGDCIIQDEISQQVGEDSQTVSSALKNVIAQVRQSQISLIFITPVPKEFFAYCNIVLETFGWTIKGEITRNILILYANIRDALKEKALGHIQLKRLTTEEIEQEYSDLKDANLERLQKQTGLSFVQINEQEITYYSELVIKRLQARFQHLWLDVKKGLLKSFVRRQQFPKSPRFMKHVIEEVWFRIGEEKMFGKLKPQKAEPEPFKLDFKPAKEFIEYMEDFIKVKMSLYRIENANSTDCAILYKYYLKLDKQGNRPPADTIKLETGLRIHVRTIHRRMIALRDFLTNPDVSRQIGELFESYYYQKGKNEGLEIRKGGGNTGEPDILILNEETGVWEPYSLKLYHREREKSVTIPKSEIGLEEQRLAEETGVIHIVFLNPFWGEIQTQTLTWPDFNKRTGVTFRMPLK